MVVDLDGTLVFTDTLFESAIALIKLKPWSVIWLAGWLVRGKAVLKAKIAEHISVSADTLPYSPELIAFLQTERSAGRTIDSGYSGAPKHRQRGRNQYRLVRRGAGQQSICQLEGFPEARTRWSRNLDCAGLTMSAIAAKIFLSVPQAASPTSAGSGARVPASALAAGAKQGRVFAGPTPTFRCWMRALRVHQWVKNVLLFVPTLAAHRLDREVVTTLLITFFGFSFLASGTYVINDLFDLVADRKHPRKSKRPFASGEFSIARGVLLAFVLIATGFAFGAAVGLDLVLCLVAYLALTLTYSTYLKNKPIIDVVALALLYTLRVYTGGIVSGFNISPWLFQFSIFLFLSLAFRETLFRIAKAPKRA